MKWNEIVTEGVDLECPNCGEHIGKASELPRGKVSCGNCGDQLDNPYGYNHSRGSDEKFGRLVFTNVTNEEGCIQGIIKTAKGVTLGSLIQYGPKWLDYDNGNWEAYCSAIKKRQSGFPDKKKAVEWIARQTRAAQKSQVTESESQITIFGHTIPNWEVEADQNYVAEFVDDPYYAPAQVYYELGNWQVYFHSEDVHSCKSQEEAEAVLTKYGYTDYQGWESFAVRIPHGMDES